MEKTAHRLLSSDGMTELYAAEWQPGSAPRAVLQLVHGMVEFIDRYDRFAREMAEHGILVAGADLLGHGASVRSRDDWGFFGEHGGNGFLIEDIRALYHFLDKRYPGIPHFILGHSMGSFLVRQYLHTHPEDHFDGAVIMGTGMQPRALVSAGRMLAGMVRTFRGSRHRSPFLTSLVLGNCNKPFEPARTPCDWLTRDDTVVDLYVRDPRNQFMFTAAAYADMFSGMRSLYRKTNLERMDRNTPILIVSGQEDPVGGMGNAVPKLYEQFRKLGFGDLEMKLYPGARHELLNETSCAEVDRDLLGFVERHLG